MAEKKSQTEGKEVAEVSDDELKALMNQNAKLQEKENDGDSVKADYLLLAKDNCKAMKKKEEEPVEEAPAEPVETEIDILKEIRDALKKD